MRAEHRFARISATKVRPWADLVRGRGAEEGLALLRYVPNRGARMLEKVIKSAIANAENQHDRDARDLLIADCRVNDGPMFKRLMPRARGMAYLVRKRFCHICVGLE